MTVVPLAAEPARSTPTDILLSCRSVAKSYGGVRALRGVDLDIRRGEVHGLVGPNGAGKSTLMKVIAGAVVPTSGDVVLDGEPLTGSDPREAAVRGIVLVPQEMTTVGGMTIAENITLGAEPRRKGFYDTGRAAARARAAMAAVGLDLDPRAGVDRLSPTYQRLVMIATAFDRSARLVILDEPTAGLPQHEASLVLAAVQRLRDSGTAVVYVSHHLSEVARTCTRVTCIREGGNAGVLAGDGVTKAALVNLIHDASKAVPHNRSIAAALTSSNVDAQQPVVVLDHVSTAELTDVSLTIPALGVTGIAGLLGSGAKDLAALLAGVSRVTGGTMTMAGEKVVTLTPSSALRRGVSFLAGDRSRSALQGATVADNVTVSAPRSWSRAGFLQPRAETGKVRALLEQLSVQAAPHRGIGELSGGNQQRVLVGRCLASDAVLIVLDEPTVGVDVASREELWAAVRAIAETRAVVVASSEPEELVALCSQVICVAHGTVVEVLHEDDLSESRITSTIS